MHSQGLCKIPIKYVLGAVIELGSIQAVCIYISNNSQYHRDEFALSETGAIISTEILEFAVRSGAEPPAGLKFSAENPFAIILSTPPVEPADFL